MPQKEKNQGIINFMRLFLPKSMFFEREVPSYEYLHMLKSESKPRINHKKPPESWICSFFQKSSNLIFQTDTTSWTSTSIPTTPWSTGLPGATNGWWRRPSRSTPWPTSSHFSFINENGWWRSRWRCSGRPSGTMSSRWPSSPSSP